MRKKNKQLRRKKLQSPGTQESNKKKDIEPEVAEMPEENSKKL